MKADLASDTILDFFLQHIFFWMRLVKQTLWVAEHEFNQKSQENLPMRLAGVEDYADCSTESSCISVYAPYVLSPNLLIFNHPKIPSFINWIIILKQILKICTIFLVYWLEKFNHLNLSWLRYTLSCFFRWDMFVSYVTF